MVNLVWRLRESEDHLRKTDPLLQEAADEIEWLRHDIERHIEIAAKESEHADQLRCGE